MTQGILAVRQQVRQTAESLRQKTRDIRLRVGASPSVDPSASLFTGIRRRLTLWYSGVLAGILLLASVLLFLGVRTALLGPIPGYLTDAARQISAAWQSNTGLYTHGERLPPTCPIPSGAARHVPYIECFGPLGASSPSSPAILPQAFQDPSLAQAALAHADGQASDTVQAENGLGAIERYALIVHDPASHAVLGVIVVGIPIEGQLAALRVLLVLLLLVGVLTLAGSLIGGLFLSSRALAPARLAFARQQTFIADASHELRTPLTLLRADAEVLLRGRQRLDPEDAGLLEDIVTEAGHMGVLATNLLTLARLDAGSLHVEREVVDLGEVVAQALRRVHALAGELRVTIEQAGEEHLLVIGDRTLLEQVTLILVDNALKYNRADGRITVRLARHDAQARLEVQDTGIGIPAHHLPHLGERFYRVDKARSREAGGAGLGLSIARGIAATHHGTLTLASVPDQGTTATLTLPAAREAPPD
jgi:signal transduction histidine kinase